MGTILIYWGLNGKVPGERGDKTGEFLDYLGKGHELKLKILFVIV